VEGRGRGLGEREEGEGKRGVMTQSLYAHMNKGNKKKIQKSLKILKKVCFNSL
jgi:hypothetical protein